jgi:iron(III) transport system substrate-binding protein
MAPRYLRSSVQAVLLPLATALIIACAPAAAPPSTTAPAASAPTSAPAKTEAAKSDAPKSVAPAAQPAAPSKPDSAAVLTSFYEKARSSGQTKIHMYGASLNEFEPIVDAFRQRFPGIEVETQIFRAPESMQRLAAEATSGKQVGNVVSHGETSMSTMDADGVFADWEGPPNAALLPGISVSAGRTRWPLNEAVHGMMINTSLVPPDKYPTSPQSFLDPFYRGKGKLLLEDPRSTGASLDFFTQASDKYGHEFLDKVKAQEPTFTRDRILAPIQVARGEFAVFFPMSIAAEHFELQAAGGVKVEILKELPTTTTTSIAVVKGAPGQDAAKLWVSWLLSEEGQRTLTEKKAQYAALPGIPPPAGWPAFSELQLSRRTEDQTARNA